MKRKQFLLPVILAFFGALCFISLNSVWADANNLNGVLKVLAWLSWIAAAIWIGVMYVKQGGNPNRG